MAVSPDWIRQAREPLAARAGKPGAEESSNWELFSTMSDREQQRGPRWLTSQTTANVLAILLALVLMILTALIMVSGGARAAEGEPGGSGITVRIKDITRVYGVRGNQLIGYGLVVGLRGTGDSRSAPYTARSVANMLEKFMITVDPSEVKSKNIAAVMVTAVLPPFAKPGDAIDIVASSIGDAKSLLGGTLLLTELAGLDSKVYAMAQGQIVAGADAMPTVGRIPSGATVEGYVPMEMVSPEGYMVLSLINPDYTTATRIADAVCARFGSNSAVAIDGGSVRVTVPESLRQTPTPFAAELGELQVKPDAPARVVVNSRTGVVVVGANVKISPAAVSYNGFSVLVGAAADASAGSTVVLEAGSTIQTLVAALNAVGARPRDVMSIMEALKACGALQAELEVM
jgi:flagellar P-ring protein precursor FlgI